MNRRDFLKNLAIGNLILPFSPALNKDCDVSDFSKRLNDNRSCNIVDYKRISIPLIRKQFPSLIIDKF